jgi:hypothetical protein
MQIREYSQNICNWLHSTADKITLNFHFHTIMVLKMLTGSAKDSSTKPVTVVCTCVFKYISTYIHMYVCMHVCMYICMYVYLETDKGQTRVSKHMSVAHGSYRSHMEYNCFTTALFWVIAQQVVVIYQPITIIRLHHPTTKSKLMVKHLLYNILS